MDKSSNRSLDIIDGHIVVDLSVLGIGLSVMSIDLSDLALRYIILSRSVDHPGVRINCRKYTMAICMVEGYKYPKSVHSRYPKIPFTLIQYKS
jgi:hypothetical protein